MPQFFSQAPLDFGAKYLYQGRADLGAGIAGGLNAAMDAQDQRKKMEMASKLEEDRAKRAREQALIEEANPYGGPVMGPDGKVDAMRTAVRVQQGKQQEALMMNQLMGDADYARKLRAAGDPLGVPRPGQSPAPQQPAAPTGMAPGGNDMTPEAAEAALKSKGINPTPALVQQVLAKKAQIAAMPPDQQQAYAQQIAQAQQAQQLKQVEEEAKARAEATSPYRERYTDKGAFQAGGKYIGNAVRDSVSGQIGMMGQDGKLVPLPEGAEPITSTGLQKAIPGQPEFRKLKGDLTSAEISLRNMDRYISSVGDANQGMDRLADNFTAGIKTLMGQGLDPKELSLKMAQGQLQGLLGANRTNVVGGGVMTEQDALRIIERLGGDVTALSNPQQVRAAISQVYSDRYKQYMDDKRFYDAAVTDYYGAHGFEKSKDVPFSANLTDDYGVSQPAAAAQPTAPATGFKVLSIKQVK